MRRLYYPSTAGSGPGRGVQSIRMRAFVQAVAGTIEQQQPDVGFVLRQIDRMPVLPRTGVAVLELAFQLSCLLARGRLFQHLPAARRSDQLVAWRNSRWPLCRDFVMLHEGLLWFSAYAGTESR